MKPNLGPDRAKSIPNGGNGRPKGAVNRVTKQLKGMILGALDKAGGQKYLQAQAEKNPVAFMTLLGKVLPTTLAGDPDAPLSGMSPAEIDARIAELLKKRQ